MRTLRLLVCCLLTAAVLAIASVSATLPADAAGNLQFGKFLVDPAGKDTRKNAHLNKEYIVLRNTSSKAVKLAGHRVKDKAGHTYVFGKGFVLKGKKSVTIHTGTGKNTASHVYWKQKNYVWNNTGDTAYLQNTKGKKLDTCAYKKRASGWMNC